MSDNSNNPAQQRVIELAESFFGQPVKELSAPGGNGRSSFRLTLGDQSVIATLRPNFRRTHLEAFVLGELEKYGDDQPRCLGVVEDVMFQSDAGERRLNIEIAHADAATRMNMAHDAVAAIFRIQSAARQTQLPSMMPHLGTNDEWVMNLVGGIGFLSELGEGISPRFDHAAACDRLAVSGNQFVKWDCRSGNAAMDDTGKLRWFDFEYAGMRHGAEDVAWLIGDEVWPIAPEDMVDVVIDCFDPSCGHSLEDYLDYLSVYLTFHSVQRLGLICAESRNRGWLSKERIRGFDDVGVHPAFAAQICGVGAYYSAQSRITAPLSPNFLAARDGFTRIDREHEERELRRA